MSRSNPVGGLFRLVIILAVFAALVCIFAPVLLNGPIAKEINTHFDGTITVESADLSMWPLRLELHDVHIKNPSKYPDKDMMTVGEIKIDASFSNAKTLLVKSITYSEVAGYPEFIDNVDNFAVYQDYLNNKAKKIPVGRWRWPVAVDTVQMRNAWLGNQDPLVKLDDHNFDPIGTQQNPVSLQQAFITSLNNVLTQQRKALPKLVLENVKQKMGKAMDSIGKALEDFSK